MNENEHHSLICLSTWSPVGGTVGEGLGGSASLEVNLEISKDHFIASYTSHPYCSSLMLADQDVSFQLLLQCHALSAAAILPTMIVMDSNFLKLLAPNKLFHGVLSQP